MPGAAPAFAAGDVYRFRALQPYAVSNVRTPPPSVWKWDDESEIVLDIDLGSVQSIDHFPIAMHTLPEGVTIDLAGGATFPPTTWTEEIDWIEWLIPGSLTETRSARYLRLTLTNAQGGEIGWLPACEALALSENSPPADVQRPNIFRILRGDGTLNTGGTTLGRGRGARVTWGGDMDLAEADAVALDAMADYVKRNDDQAIIVVPHIDRPAEAVIGRIEEDQLVFEEASGNQRNDADDRYYKTSFSVSPVMR